MIRHDQAVPTTALFARLRREYTQRGLDEADAPPEPWALFTRWMHEAIEAQIAEPNAMAVATAGADGRPGVRTVLMKQYDANGVVFFTNFQSRKGRELLENPQASALLFWKELERQIRIDGTVKKVTPDESDLYFQSRPFDARIGALASPQSEPVASRDILENAFNRLRAEHDGKDVARPPHWGGFRLSADSIEFWQGRPNRLHDRLLYTRAGPAWTRERLAP
ncbi:MAG TPA: pyridoxamine 5'-phosphate oxidase [Kiritimatiellia bacterium]|nr:pyridoxamine 5'-phosphate oxidase [Kiritimatiellia bacterium]